MHMVIKSYFSLLLLSLCCWNFLWSQDSDAETIGMWYLEHRFLIADNDLDETLDPAEIKIIQGEFAYYLNGNHYDKCDLNHDNLLSRDEVNKHAIQEWNYRLAFEQQEIQKLIESHPELAQPDARSLKANPELVQTLLSNYTWTSQYAELVFDIMSDRSWLTQNPEAIKIFHYNFRWLADFPQYAARFYNMRDWGSHVPKLREWRRNHQAFISAHPAWGKGDIRLKLPDFITPVSLEITDNNSLAVPDPLVDIQNYGEEPVFENFNQHELQDSIRILQAQLAQANLNIQRQQQKFETLEEQLKNAEYEQVTHLSQMRSERETLITTAERQRKELQDLKQELAYAEERLNQYIDLTSSGSDAMREEAVTLKAENKKLSIRIQQLESEKTQLADDLHKTEIQKETRITPVPATLAQIKEKDSLIAANTQLEQDLVRLGQELSQLAETNASIEHERDELRKANLLADQQQASTNESLQLTTNQQTEEIQNLRKQLNALQESQEAQLQRAHAQTDSVSAINMMLSTNQAEMKTDLRRLVRENATLASNLEKLNTPSGHDQVEKDSLLFEALRHQREVALLRTEMERIKSRLNDTDKPAPTTPIIASSKEAALSKEIQEKKRQLEQMTDKFIDMAAEVQQTRKKQQQIDALRDSLLAVVDIERKQIGALRQSLQGQLISAPAKTDSLTQLLLAQRKEIAALQAESEKHQAYTLRRRMVFDSLVALTAKLPDLEAGMNAATQTKQSLSQAEVDLKKAKQKIAELEFERQKLQEQVNLALQGQAMEKDEFEARVTLAQATIRELNTEVKKLKASSQYYSQRPDNQDELLKLRQQVAQLEQTKATQQKQLEASNQYVAERLSTLERLSAEVQEQKAEIARLQASNQSLSGRVNTDMISRETHLDSLTRYRSKLNQLNQQLSTLKTQRINDKTEARRQIESLEHQITQLNMKYASMDRINQVDDERLEKIKQQEAEVRENIANIDERERLLRQQESYIMGRLDELDTKEKRYQHLLQLETELRLLEQRLKQYPNYDQMRNQIRKESNE